MRLCVTARRMRRGGEVAGNRPGFLAERAASPPSALPGISPSRGEIDMRRGLARLNVSE